MIKTQESTRAFLGRLCRCLWETLACLMLLPGCGDSSTAQFERGSQGEGMLGQQSREEAKLGKSVSGGSLDDLAALMERKEEEFANRPVAFAEDFAKYRKVLSSRFADDRLKGLAWGELRKKWSTDESVSPAAALIWHEDRVMVVTAWTVPVIGMKLVPIPAGRFVIGSPSSEADRSYRERQHEVVISRPFWMGRYEATQGEWESVMGSNPSHFRGSSLPVEQVSWEDAQAFCVKLNASTANVRPSGYVYRLPTEAEWEYACRAGTTGAYAGDLDRMGWYDDNSGDTTHAVGGKQANAWGLHDMHGNVSEWCSDFHDDYPSGPVTDPVGADSGLYRVNRGGSWNLSARYCRAAIRYRYPPGYRLNCLGFRLCLSLGRVR